MIYILLIYFSIFAYVKWVIWHRLGKIDDPLNKMDEKINSIDKRLVAIETLLHMKECCVLKDDRIKQKAE